MANTSRHKLLTVTAIEKLRKPREGARLRVMDSKIANFGVSVTDTGTKTFFLVARFPGSTSGPARRELGKVASMSLADARQKAAKWNTLIAAGKDPAREEDRERRGQIARDASTVDAVLDAFEKDHVEGLRSGDQVKAAFAKHVRPRIGARSIYDLRRSDITAMLNAIKASSGPVMADRVLAYVRKAFNWQMVQDDEFKSPIVRGMAKTKPAERSRKRALTDEEIRDVWAALDQWEGPACYPRFVKSLLLTATRRNESSEMHADEIEGDMWTIPAARYKNKRDHVIPITPAMRELIGEKPVGFVFSTTGGAKPFSGFSKAKRELDRIVDEIRKREGRPAMKQWQLHDLRRTGRSLMSRAGVPTDHAERAMGHVIGGVRETYDRHEFLKEKREAFEALAQLVTFILNPPLANVVALLGARQ
jgi:integrase